MTTPVVIDASAGVEFLLKTAAGASLRKSMPADAEEWVPEHYFTEVAGVIRRAELNGRITSHRASVALDKLLASHARAVRVLPLLSEAWTLRQNVTVADAIYVCLARHLGAPLFTGDIALSNAPNLGIAIVVP